MEIDEMDILFFFVCLDMSVEKEKEQLQKLINIASFDGGEGNG